MFEQLMDAIKDNITENKESSEKEEGLNIFDVAREILAGDVVDNATDELEENVDLMDTANETYERMDELLDGTDFQKRFDTLFGDEKWPEQFERFNKKISHITQNYAKSMLWSYDTAVHVEMASGLQFALMQTLNTMGTEKATKFFERFKGNAFSSIKWFFWTAIEGFSGNSEFFVMGQRYQNLMYILEDHASELKNDPDHVLLQSEHIPELVNDSQLDSISNFDGKTLTEVTTMLQPEIYGNPDVYLQDIANTSADKLDKDLLESIGGKKGLGGAIRYASKFFRIRPDVQKFLSAPLKLVDNLTDNALWRSLFGGKSFSEYLKEKKSGKVADFVLGIMWFRGGLDGLMEDKTNVVVDKKTPQDVDNDVTVDTNIETGTGIQVTTDTYLDYVSTQIEKVESAWGKYDAFNPADGESVTWVSLSQHQFHDALAQELFQYMRDQNSDLVKNYMGAEFMTRIDDPLPSDASIATEDNIWRWPSKTKKPTWWANCDANWTENHPDYVSGFKALMNNSEAQKLVVVYKQETIKSYIKLGRNLNPEITDPKVMVYFCRLCNYGSGTAKSIYEKSDGTLADFHRATKDKRANDKYDPIWKIYQPLYDELLKDNFDNVDIDKVV